MSAPATFRGVPVDQLREHPGNVRQTFDGIEELADSIRARGIQQPLIVNERGPDVYVVTDGHRRLRAARLAQVPVIPCIVTTGQDARSVRATMLAAAMHQQLTPLEQARAFKQCRDDGMLVPDIARSTGYSQALVKNRLLLLELPAEAQDMVEADELTLGQATALAKQVKATKSGTVGANTSKSMWLSNSHRLARYVRLRCDHGDSRRIVGTVGCGQCWEEVIREDATGKVNTDLTFDEAIVQRILAGDQVDLTRRDRLEAVRRLAGQGMSDSRIAAQVGTTDRQVLRDRQTLSVPSPIGRPGHNERQTA
jgi:ParB/RepB/Spo0J family partition protein